MFPSSVMISLTGARRLLVQRGVFAKRFNSLIERSLGTKSSSLPRTSCRFSSTSSSLKVAPKKTGSLQFFTNSNEVLTLSSEIPGEASHIQRRNRADRFHWLSKSHDNIRLWIFLHDSCASLLLRPGSAGMDSRCGYVINEFVLY